MTALSHATPYTGLKDKLATFDSCQTIKDVIETFSDFLKNHDVTGYSVSASYHHSARVHAVADDLPKQLDGLDSGLNRADKHPLIKLARNRSFPEVVTDRSQPNAKCSESEAWFDMLRRTLPGKTGVCFPVHPTDRCTYAFFLLFDAPRVGDVELLFLHAICQIAANQIEVLHKHSLPDNAKYILTRRERECLHLSAHGLTEKLIALRLGLSPNTIRVHVENAKRRLGASNKVHAIILAVLHEELSLTDLMTPERTGHPSAGTIPSTMRQFASPEAPPI